jgi:hypothetical protein
MAITLCIQRANLDVDEMLIRTIFQQAFDEDMNELIIKIDEHILFDHILAINYKSFFIHLKHSTFRINLFIKDIHNYGFAQLSFGNIYVQFISKMEFYIFTSPHSSYHNSHNFTTWNITL